jgi:large subunit ribosomal protein L10
MRPEKIAIVNEIRAKVAGSSFLIMANYKGMKVGQIKELRKRLAKLKSGFHVVKNSFFKKAVAELPEIKIDEKLDMPLAIVVGQDDGIETVKALDKFRRDFNVSSIEFGFLGGRHWSAAEFGQLIKLPPRITLLGMLAGGLAAPLSGLAGVMRQKLASVVYALQAVQELKSKSGSK